jgi:hypothetical protein
MYTNCAIGFFICSHMEQNIEDMSAGFQILNKFIYENLKKKHKFNRVM